MSRNSVNTYDALPPAEQAALPPVEAITAAFTSTGELTANAQTNTNGTIGNRIVCHDGRSAEERWS